MRFIKLFFISLVIIFLLLTGMSLLLPSHVRISRAINIAAPAGSISSYVSKVDNWWQWNAFADSSISISLVSAKQDSISTSWSQPNGKKWSSNFSFAEAANVTVVQWYFDFHLRWYPWEKFGSIIYDERMGPGMEKSLAKLKSLMETSQ